MAGEIRFGLTRVIAALEAIGSPHADLAGRLVHVAGTNGKGSVCSMVYSVLKHSGISVGLFTSPHLIEQNDAVKLAHNGQEVAFDREEWAALREEVQKVLHEKQTALDITSFELQVVMVLLLFSRHKVDAAVIEVGLGGAEDATNVLVEPAACAITSISLDHQDFLGSTREEIARHKAGIFQDKRPALISTYNMDASVQATIAACADEVGASPVRWVSPAQCTAADTVGQTMRVSDVNCDIRVPLNGDFQRGNAALAVGLLAELRSQSIQLRSREGKLDSDFLSDNTISSGISRTMWPGRLEWTTIPDYGRILIDGAHNVDAAIGLGAYVNESVRKAGAPIAWVVALSKGKDSRGLLEHLLQDGDIVLAVSFSEVVGMPWVKPQDPKDIVEVAQSVRPGLSSSGTCKDFQEALAAVHEKSSSAQVVLCGSLYLISEVARYLKSQSL